MKYTIDRQYITSVTIHRSWSPYDGRDDLTDEELVRVLKGLDRCSSTSNDDHPEFKLLRDRLEQDGYIKTERGWWNGDRVLKSFTLNDIEFNPGDQFPSSAALDARIRIVEKFDKDIIQDEYYDPEDKISDNLTIDTK
jgi:hypothetical protein